LVSEYPVLRSFIAIELPVTVRTVLAEMQHEFSGCGADVRWVKPGSIHLTLEFLGDIKDEDAGRIIDVIKGTCKEYPAFQLEITGTGVFPNTRAPRVLWVGLDNNETLSALQASIANSLISLGFQPEKRRFVPHLTIGRFRSFKGKDILLKKVSDYKSKMFGIIKVNSVSLMSSELGPSGAKYSRIAEIFLKEDV